MSIYNEQNTALMQASHAVTGQPFYTGKVVYTFVGKGLCRTNPASKTSIAEVAKILKRCKTSSGCKHLVIEMINGIVQKKEVET